MSAASDLSDLSSADFSDDGHASDAQDNDVVKPPPAKKRRVNQLRSPRQEGTPSSAAKPSSAADQWSDISSDTSGSVPPSPKAWRDLAVATDELTVVGDHVRICQWNGCPAGDLGDQDELVRHMNEVHVPESKDDRYACDWGDCKTKTRPQMSGYALKAHMRSHTKEKPFYCALPECDRNFTRSDALNKHMRTVHESEALRTIEHYTRAPPRTSVTATNTPNPEPATAKPDPPKAEPIPYQTSQSKGPVKLKLFMNGKGKSSPTPNGAEYLDEIATAPLTPMSPGTRDDTFGPLPRDLQFDAHEAALDRRELFKLLRRKIHWAEQDGRDLQGQFVGLEEDRKEAWMAKELAMEKLLEAEYATGDLAGVFDQYGSDTTFGLVLEEDIYDDRPPEARQDVAEKERVLRAMDEDYLAAAALPIEGNDRPWYRSEEVMENLSTRRISQAARHEHPDPVEQQDMEQQDTAMGDGDETEDEV